MYKNTPKNYYNLDNSSNSDEYIDISDNFTEINKKIFKVFQFQPNHNKLVLKHIGNFSQVPDIIIKEEFGPDSNMYLYNCVYSQEELGKINDKLSDNEYDNIDLNENIDLNDNNDNNKEDETFELFFPLVKLIIADKTNPSSSIITVKLCSPIKLSELTKSNEIEINDWELYWIQNVQTEEYVKVLPIEKNISHSNIIEKFMELNLSGEKIIEK